MTHRVFSRNSASSRAIPIQKILARVLRDPATPVWWGRNQSGMQAEEALVGLRLWLAKQLFYKSRFMAVAVVWLLWKVGLHKQLANRLLEPWMWMTVICTGTNYEHFFQLRCHKDAQPEIRAIALLMRDAYENNIPTLLRVGEWHLPYIADDERNLATNAQIKLSIARCARVSFLTHDGVRDAKKDVELYTRLLDSGHWSPFEHAAQAMQVSTWCGNFKGWRQARKAFPQEFIERAAA